VSKFSIYVKLDKDMFCNSIEIFELLQK